jgi:hypothetical protein
VTWPKEEATIEDDVCSFLKGLTIEERRIIFLQIAKRVPAVISKAGSITKGKRPIPIETEAEGSGRTKKRRSTILVSSDEEEEEKEEQEQEEEEEDIDGTTLVG